jgi:hypothetical protein
MNVSHPSSDTVKPDDGMDLFHLTIHITIFRDDYAAVLPSLLVFKLLKTEEGNGV